MDLNLLNILAQNQPIANKEVCEGLAYHQLLHAEKWIHEAFIAASKAWPKDLVYKGPQRCTPEEQFIQVAKKNKKQYEIAKNDVYLVKYRFDYQGVFLKYVYFLIPFSQRGGLIYLNGALYKITPVIGGKIFNIEEGNIFMPVPKNRALVFKGVHLNVAKNGKLVNTNGVYSPLHHFRIRTDRSNFVSSLVHYILAKYGLSKTLNNLFDLNAVIGDISIEEQYKETHDVYRSAQWKSVMKKGGKEYTQGSVLRIAIPKEKYNKVNDSVMASIFYIIDKYPGAIHLEDLDESELWLRVLDKFIFKTSTIDKKGLEHLNAHMQSVENMLDKSTIDMLYSEDIKVNNIFELFKFIIYDYNDLVIHEDSGSMFNKEINVLKYFLYNIVHAINTFSNEIIKFDESQLNAKKIAKKLDDLLPIYATLTVRGHGELTPVSVSVDFMPYYATCNLMSRAKAASGGRNKRNQKNITDPLMLVHSSQVEVTTFGWITKADPTGRGKANPFTYFDRPFHTCQHPNNEERLKNIQQYLTHN